MLICVSINADVMNYENDIPYVIIYNLPKTKKFGCVDRGDLTSLFFSKVAKSVEVRGDLCSNVENKKSFTSLPSNRQNYALALNV